MSGLAACDRGPRSHSGLNHLEIRFPLARKRPGSRQAEPVRQLPGLGGDAHSSRLTAAPFLGCGP